MSEVVHKPRMGIKQNPEARAKIQAIEKLLVDAGAPQRKTGELDKQEGYKIVHSFGDGIYVRECRVPKGFLFVSELHKFDHPFFLLAGRLRICTEEEDILLEAPHYGITPKGTKRVVFVEEDVVWVTCHATKENNTEKIEQEILADSYEEFELEEKL